MRKVEFNISFNVSEEDYNSKKFQQYLEDVKSGKIAKEFSKDTIVEVFDTKIKLK